MNSVTHSPAKRTACISKTAPDCSVVTLHQVSGPVAPAHRYELELNLNESTIFASFCYGEPHWDYSHEP